jgi:hypothetical protein
MDAEWMTMAHSRQLEARSPPKTPDETRVSAGVTTID